MSHQKNALPPVVVLVLAVVLAGYYFLQPGSQETKTTSPAPSGEFDASGGVMKIQFLDVGQGDAILVTSPEGKTMLYDGGRSTSRMKEHIEELGLTKLDIMVASHGDFDHINGLNEAVKLKPTYFINNGIAADTATYRKLIRAVKAAKTQGLVARDRNIELGSVKLHVFDIPKGLGDDQNANSVGILIERGSFKAFLGGDSEKDTMEGWLNQYSKVLKEVNVYKSAHHGSPHNDNAEFLSVVSPEVVVIGVGPNNYGHPSEEAIDLYKKYSEHLYRTDLNGMVTIEVDASGHYRTTTEKGREE
ncbi:ComEC/Rec2 family competence protein [Deinococcus cellulosilyticus]|uniref:Competence protein ComEC n=1 Tax=Deinococcus cellulosilyticus (strain DSM 18568 / NBRC 106333 / KACC 11606 / 5516J-15) TaxID=1223518 RepID=A0A511N6T8_DEIC1|nr:MBL fold metallo-hydrolase [Deinococcus cellulosilyticus]GEM48573.1 competence protein ComEC [Deinococcus cellulosilyticus NBRC 106333 = KACC 11606]